MSNQAMVQELRKTGYVKSKRVEDAMLAVDRALFVPRTQYPYADRPFPVGRGQTISAPSVVGLMLDHLDARPGMKVLEIGTGSGYNAALLSYLVGPGGKVISIDIVPELTELAKRNLEKIGSPENVELITADGSGGYGKEAPYDRIIVTAAMPSLDEDHPLLVQLKKDGRLVAPVGGRFFQDTIVYDRKTGRYEKVLPVVFVPLLGRFGFKR